jgi:type I restriction enzyme S subunit
MAINQSCYGIYSKSNYSQPVTYLLIQSLMNHFVQVSYGSVFDTITTSTFQNINILLPPESILNEIKNNIDEYFTQIKQNVIENQTLTKLRDTLLPKLISGKIRLKEFKKEVSTIL